jgi:hypothetical protein
MRKIMLVLVSVACLSIVSCHKIELSEQDKAKVASIKVEIEKIEKEVALAEKDIPQGATGLIPALQQERVEVDKLTLSILRQHAAAIESGSGITLTAPATNPDPALAAEIESEMRAADSELNKTKAESSQYSGGLIKVTIDARAATQELTLAMLKQKHLAAKYGLAISPASAPTVSAKTQTQTQAQGPDATIQKESQPATQAKEQEVDDPGPFDFRKVRWGMSKDDVMKRETSKPFEENEDAICYHDEILGHKSDLCYYFTNGKLYRAIYSLDNSQYSNNNRYVDAYTEIVTSLTGKYGKPTNKRDVWSNNLFKGDYQRRGMAYSADHVASGAEWDRDNENIHAGITGNNYKIGVFIEYENKILAKEADKAQKKNETSKF